MRHKIGYNRLGRKASHRKALHRNMTTSLFRHERIKTTKAKALAVRRTAEKMITRSKVDSVHNRRVIAKDINDKEIVAKLFTDIGPRFKERPGGYTRILKLGYRKGDAAEMVLLELVENDVTEKKTKKKSSKAVKSVTSAETEKKAETKTAAPKKAEKKTEEKVESETKKSETKKKAADTTEDKKTEKKETQKEKAKEEAAEAEEKSATEADTNTVEENTTETGIKVEEKSVESAEDTEKKTEQ